jgi:mucin-19
VVFWVVAVSVFGSATNGAPWAGNGTADAPYQIWDACDMQAIGADANYWDAHFKLMADIDLAEYTGTQFNIIGNGTQSFTGYFDGNNRTVSNFSYNETGTNYIGLFGRTGNVPADVGQIRNLTLDIVDVNGGSGRFVGAMVGHARGSVINCRVNGGVVQGQEDVGGLIGSFAYCVVANCSAGCDVEGGEDVGGLTGNGGDQSAMIQCFATGQINGEEYVGGLMGRNSGEIIRCYATGDVIGTPSGYSTGGLAGMSGPESVIQDSFSRGDVEGGFYVGGFLGMNWQAAVTDCYSVGSVSGVTLVGGFIGNNNLPGSNINCFWDNQSSGQDFGVGAGSSDGIYGRSTAEMKMESTFTNAGWDFNTPIWSIEEGIDYPTLVFQEYVHDYGGGSGTEEDPFLIYTAEHMQEIGAKEYHWGMNFKLMNNIDLGQYDGQEGRERFNKIGYYNNSSDYQAFTGVFDGNNCTISNFIYITTTENMVGLFGYSAEEGVVIKNLGLINPNVSAAEGYQQIGALVGLFRDGTLENCYVQDANVTGDFMVGALVGRLGEGTILHCQASGSVVGNEEVGGLVGENDRGEIYYCEADVSVSASSYESGGLLGELSCGLAYGCGAHGDVNGADITGGLIGANPLVFSGTTCTGDIIDCYATGNVSSGGSAGGLVSFSAGPLIRCSASGSVKGGLYVGGLAGNAGDITECYATGDASGEDAVGGLAGTSSYVMSDSFALGEVNGRYDIGGLSGINYGTIQNCYSIGFVSGLGGVGGLVGYNDADGNIVNSFWDKETSKRSNMCWSGSGGSGCDDSCGKTTTEMKMRATFTSTGWDFVGETINGPNDIWDICDGTNYPKLARQVPLAGDFVCPDGVDIDDLAALCEEWLLAELSADVWPEGGDGIVNFLDWAVFANQWQITIDFETLADFADQWLKTGANYYIADIAPDGGDGIVNMLDFAVFANNWLQQN